VELFEGHARSGDVRGAKYTGASLLWTDHTFDREPT
jgi:sulfopropanediol 3-dehydrogenase